MARFSDEEFESLAVAASLKGVTTTSWTASTAVAVANGVLDPPTTGMVDAIGELLQARYQVTKFSALVNQAVAKWHSTDDLPPELVRAVAMVGRVLPQLEEAAVAVKSAYGGNPERALQAPRRRARPAPATGRAAPINSDPA